MCQPIEPNREAGAQRHFVVRRTDSDGTRSGGHLPTAGVSWAEVTKNGRPASVAQKELAEYSAENDQWTGQLQILMHISE